MAKGYSGKNVTAAIKSVYEGANEEEEAETFDTITNDYWDTQAENTADYEMMFNAYMNGKETDYNKLWDTLEKEGKEEKNIKSSMKSRLKTAYQNAKESGDYQKAQKAKKEFLRLGGKPETLEKE